MRPLSVSFGLLLAPLIATAQDATGEIHFQGNRPRVQEVTVGWPDASAAIRAATVDAARCLGVEDELGSVREGRRADLLIVRGDPSADVSAVSDIRHVILDGWVYSRSELRTSGSRP